MDELKPCPFCGSKAQLVTMLGRSAIACYNCPAIMIRNYDADKRELILAWNNRDNNVVEIEGITSVITRLRSNRDSNLTRYTSNEGKESHIIVSQKDRGYFQALDDIEEALLKNEKTDEAEHISQPINTENEKYN